MKGFSIIVAMDACRGIGRDNRIPWHLPEDMRHFKEITMNQGPDGGPNVVIMGRKTWESLPANYRPLPGRKNAVLTSRPFYPVPGNVLLFNTLDKALTSFCQEDRTEKFGEIFVIGGAQVYAEAIRHPLCKKIYLTVLDRTFSCDAFFPVIPDFMHETTRSKSLYSGKTGLVFIVFERYPISNSIVT